MHLKPLDPTNPAHRVAIVSLWNAACGADLAINARCVAYNTRAATGAAQAGRIAIENGNAVGFVVASALPGDPRTSPPELGWIDAIAVAPEFQRRGIGSALLAWAEDFLRAQNCTCFRLGSGLRPFAPGLPVELGTENFFRTRGYAPRAESATVWDLARDLSDYSTIRPSDDATNHPTTRPAQAGDEPALLEFLNREFPNRWRFEFEEFLRARGNFSDYYLLTAKRDNCISAFARLTLEDSERPIERFFMRRLPRPWGQLGPLGVSRDARGKGYGAALVDAALRYLQARGVRGCVIDWTTLTDFYAKFGFAPFREYEMLEKRSDRAIRYQKSVISNQ